MLDIFENLKKAKKRIIFPEGDDNRIIEAAEELKNKEIIEPVLVRKEGIDGIECVHPETDSNFKALLNKFFEKMKKRINNIEEAEEILKNPLYYSAMKLEDGYVDGFVGGAANSTAETVRALLRCIGLKDGISVLSSFFIMILKERKFIFSDCAIIPNPSSQQLAEIAIASARAARNFLKEKPKVALLSYSTSGSAKGKEVEKVQRAVEILKEKKVDFEFFGEIQLDAAIVPEIAFKKTKGKWDGDANVLIFPDLNSGNIGYKLVERLAGATAMGPILQGLKKPGNDLSRGCSKNDIIYVAQITAIQSMEN